MLLNLQHLFTQPSKHFQNLKQRKDCKKFVYRIRAFIKRPSSSPIKWAAYYTPFSMGPWTILGISVIVTGASISFVTYIEAKSVNENNDEPASLTDTILGVFGALCGQGKLSIFYYN